MPFAVAVYGQLLSFNQLTAQGGVYFPGEGIMLPKFSRPLLVPNINLPPDIIFAARGREHPAEVNETEEDTSTKPGFVNTVWNNIENYLPSTVIEEGVEKINTR